MRPFDYQRPAGIPEAVRAAAAGSYLAGGTTMLDLMKLHVATPPRLVDVQRLGLDRIDVSGPEARVGARVTMAQAAAHPLFSDAAPVLSEALAKAASPQLRNVATLAGNVLQRTRCGYFRDNVSACNKRTPGSGCAAMAGMNRLLAVLGTSEACIASYAGDWANALVLFDAQVEAQGAEGARTIAFDGLHVAPGTDPSRETVLRPGELITGFRMTVPAWARRSRYVKVRDRDSYAFAVASAAVGLDVAGGVVREARLAVGGVATTPWRAREAERFLAGKAMSEEVAAEAGRIAFRGAKGSGHNDYKLALGPRTVMRALLETAAMA